MSRYETVRTCLGRMYNKTQSLDIHMYLGYTNRSSPFHMNKARSIHFHIRY